MNWKHQSAPRATVSLVLLRLGGTSPTVGVLGWRAAGCSAGMGRADEAEVWHCM